MRGRYLAHFHPTIGVAGFLRRFSRVNPATPTSAFLRAPTGDALPLPPADLQYHVFSREVSSEEFLEAGWLCAASLEQALSAQSLATSHFKRVLDFGCGSGRVIRHFAHLFEGREFYGSDVDASVIAWDRANIPGAWFHRNDAEPPLAFDDEYFDYLWSISVFSHLPEQMAINWIGELHRILRPGGIAIVTVHGPFRFDEDVSLGRIPSDAIAAFARRGFTYVQAFADGRLPAWYQNAFMTEAFARELFGRRFELLDYRPRGMMGRQDLLVLKRR
jgi:SAM-dependent methyltransferase